MRGKIGLFSGGIETYWKDTGMKELPDVIRKDAKRLAGILGNRFDVVYPGMAGNENDAIRLGKILRKENVDVALMYHATYIDDAMTMGFLNEIGDIFPILFLSQGIRGIPEDVGMIDSGRCWGNNSAVQLAGTFKLMKPDLKFGFVFGNFDEPDVLKEIDEYIRAVKAVKRLRKSKIAYLPHRCVSVPMYDTYPDDTMMMAQTGVKIDYLYTQDLINAMQKVSKDDAAKLCRELYQKYDVIEPSMREVSLAARQAIALHMVVTENKVDALAIDMFPELTPRCGMIPCVGMAMLIDKGIMVSTEGDLAVAVSGLVLNELTGKHVHFWEHLMFDKENNWILGGHEGGSAGFGMAKKGTKPKLRNTQYINFEGTPGAPYHGVLPEFITDPGPVTLLTLFRGEKGYEMRIACGESVDTEPRPVHFEHTIFKPGIPLERYYKRIMELGVCHHFGLVHSDCPRMIEKVADILDMKFEYLTQDSENNTNSPC